MERYRSTKSFYNYPCAHRRWAHPGNCHFIHGYSRSFHFEFGAEYLDRNGFVVDFGELNWLHGWLETWFDHTLLVDADDPNMALFDQMHEMGVCNLRKMTDGAGLEGTALFVFDSVDEILREQTQGRCYVVSVEVRENDKNSAIYSRPYVRKALGQAGEAA